MSSTKNAESEVNFSKLYKNRMEKRLVDYLEALAQLPTEDLKTAILAQKALVAKTLENIALMMLEQGYVDHSTGLFVRFSPQDLLVMTKALDMGLRMRADIMMEPMGLEALTKAMGMVDKVAGMGKDTKDSNTGLKEPPPLVAVDAPKPVVEEPVSEIKD